MNQVFLLAAIGIPILAGALAPLGARLGPRGSRIALSGVMLLTSAITWALILTAPELFPAPPDFLAWPFWIKVSLSRESQHI